MVDGIAGWGIVCSLERIKLLANLERKVMKKLYFVLLISTLLLPSIASSHDQVSTPTSIKSIYSKNNGSVFVTFDSGSLPGCYSNNGAYITGTDIDKLYSTILSAKMAEKKVRVYFNFNDVAAGYTGWSLCHIEAVTLS